MIKLMADITVVPRWIVVSLNSLFILPLMFVLRLRVTIVTVKLLTAPPHYSLGYRRRRRQQLKWMNSNNNGLWRDRCS